MGLYNVVFGPGQAEVTRLAGINPNDVMRFRDAWVERTKDGQVRIAIYTRMGGGNNSHEFGCEEEPQVGPCWGCWVDAFEEREGFVLAYDDDFDCTYRTFYFRPTQEGQALIETAVGRGLEIQGPVDMAARWQDAIDALKDVAPPPAHG